MRRLIYYMIFSTYLVLSTAHLSDASEVGVEKIRTLYAKINQLIESGDTIKKDFLLSSKGWKKINRVTNKLAAESGEMDLQENASVYLYKNKVVKAVITIVTPSGDWVNTTNYYFYENGKTAFIFENHETFQGYDFDKDEELPPGPYVIEKRFYYSEQGKEIRQLKKAFIKSNKKEIPAKFLRQVDFERYPNVSSLPFSNLLQ